MSTAVIKKVLPFLNFLVRPFANESSFWFKEKYILDIVIESSKNILPYFKIFISKDIVQDGKETILHNIFKFQIKYGRKTNKTC